MIALGKVLVLVVLLLRNLLVDPLLLLLDSLGHKLFHFLHFFLGHLSAATEHNLLVILV